MDLTPDEIELRDELDSRLPGPFGDPDMYYDIETKPITFGTWGVLHARKRSGEYGRVGSSPVGDMWISTVWLGLDHSFMTWGRHRPLIFETMIFPLTGPPRDGWMDRYSTLAEAQRGHRRAYYVAMRAGLYSRLDRVREEALGA